MTKATPVLCVRAGKYLHLENEPTTNPDVDFLLEKEGKYFLAVEHPARYNIFSRKTRESGFKVRLDRKDLDVEIVRNHPILYAGKTFVTESESRYGVTEDLCLTGRRNLEGARIDQIAGVDNEQYFDVMDFIGNKDLDGLNEYLFDNGKVICERLRLALTLKREDAQERDRIGFLTSPIYQIK